MTKSYWDAFYGRTITRRRAIAASSAFAASAALLAACGGKNSSGSSRGSADQSSGRLTKPKDTTAAASRSGLMKDRTYSDVPSLGVTTGGGAPHNAVGPMVYSSLLQIKPGLLKPTENDIAGDLMDSWETSPDGLTVTMKLRSGVKWHNKAPVNGRPVDIDDIRLAWERFSKISSARFQVVNAVNPGAPVLSLTAVNTNTIVLKLAEPIVYALEFFAKNVASSGLAIPPKEVDTTFNERTDMIGTGPFMLKSYRPSVSFTLQRNPDYWEKDDALVDEIELPIVGEYAAALAQFRAGNIYTFGSYQSTPKINADDVLPTLAADPRLLAYQGDLIYPETSGSSRRILAFGWLPDGKSPFIDERVRQAASMSWDRDLYQATFFNTAGFGAAGIPVETRWDTAVSAKSEGWWIDPKGKELGANAKYYQHNIAEAKKLLSAAGYPNGLHALSNYVTGPEQTNAPYVEVLDGFMAEAGIKSTVTSIDYAKEYIPNYRDANGQYQGWAYVSNAGSNVNDTAGALASEFWSKGKAASFKGFSLTGKNDQSGDPKVDEMIAKARLEQDINARKSLVKDLQIYLAKAMYSIPPPGAGTKLELAWPCVGNFRLYQDARPNYRLWVDKTKPPFSA